MAIVNPSNRKPTIDLGGPQGNAFFLLGTASKMAKKLDLDDKAIMEEMQSGNYDNLIAVFDRNFGDYVDLIRA